MCLMGDYVRNEINGYDIFLIIYNIYTLIKIIIISFIRVKYIAFIKYIKAKQIYGFSKKLRIIRELLYTKYKT